VFGRYNLEPSGDLLSSLGKLLIITGLAIAGIGVLLLVAPRVPWLGKLPGDILIRKDNFRFYFPITTCIIISIILTLLFYLFRK
jgi:uncharacterized protein HemY